MPATRGERNCMNHNYGPSRRKAGLFSAASSPSPGRYAGSLLALLAAVFIFFHGAGLTGFAGGPRPEAAEMGSGFIDMIFIADAARAEAVMGEIEDAGGIVLNSLTAGGLIVAAVPAEAADILSRLPGVQAAAEGAEAAVRPLAAELPAGGQGREPAPSAAGDDPGDAGGDDLMGGAGERPRNSLSGGPWGQPFSPGGATGTDINRDSGPEAAEVPSKPAAAADEGPAEGSGVLDDFYDWSEIYERQMVNLRSMQIPALWESAGVSGRGVTIAVIDTGADASHPSLQTTDYGSLKIVSWIDMTGRGTFSERADGLDWTVPAEGDLALPHEASAQGDTLVIDGAEVALGAVRSRSNVYKYGWLDPDRLAAGAGLGSAGAVPGGSPGGPTDSPFAEGSPAEADEPSGSGGSSADRSSGGSEGTAGRGPASILIMAVDRHTAGHYDTVLIDTRGTLNFRGAVPLEPYHVRGDRVALPIPSPVSGGPPHHGGDDPAGFGPTGIVVTELDPGGTYVNLGFDANGHGTHVAGLTAGYDEGRFLGAAPGARLHIIKALPGTGHGSWTQLAGAITHAVELGADVISISITDMDGFTGGGDTETRFLRESARTCGCLIVLAAGNGGPGIGTATAPGDDRFTVTVGAYVSPDMMLADYGLAIAREGVAHYSAVGPRPDGSLAPVVIAPGAARGPVPPWQVPDGYAVMEGTSMAAPQVAGAGALLVEAARRQGIVPDGERLRQALQLGARQLEGASVLEQGYGLVDALASWQVLPRARMHYNEITFDGTPGTGRLRGIYSRGEMPGVVPWRIDSPGRTGRALSVRGSSGWIRPGQQGLLLGPGDRRIMDVTYDTPRGSGLHTGWLQLTGIDGIPAGSALHVHVTPEPFPVSGARPIVRQGSLEPGQKQRLFIEVPDGAQSLNFKVKHTGGPGSARIYGSLYDASGRLRTAAALPDARGSDWDLGFAIPGPGVWELVLAGAPTVPGGGSSGASYELEIRGSRIAWSPVRVRASVRPGGTWSNNVQVSAWGAPFTGEILPFGLRPERSESSKMRLDVRQGTARQQIFVPSGASFLEVWAYDWSGSNSTPFTLSLHRHDSGGGDPWEVGRADSHRLRPASVQLRDPEGGRYTATIEAGSGASFPVAFHYRVHGGGASGGPFAVADGEVQITAGGSRMARVSLRAPSEHGRYYASLGFRDDAMGLLVGSMEVTVSVGEPAPFITGQLLRGTGGPGALSLRFLDPARFRPIEGQGRVEAEGRTYPVQGGQVIIPLSSAGSGALRLSVDLPGYAPAEVTVRPMAADDLLNRSPVLTEQSSGLQSKIRALRGF